MLLKGKAKDNIGSSITFKSFQTFKMFKPFAEPASSQIGVGLVNARVVGYINAVRILQPRRNYG
jgi:hypothetical protein